MYGGKGLPVVVFASWLCKGPTKTERGLNDASPRSLFKVRLFTLSILLYGPQRRAQYAQPLLVAVGGMPPVDYTVIINNDCQW